jgi:hypothetical protein
MTWGRGHKLAGGQLDEFDAPIASGAFQLESDCGVRVLDFRAMMNQRVSKSESLWPSLIKFWLAAILILFFVLRILYSHLGQHALNSLRHTL